MLCDLPRPMQIPHVMSPTAKLYERAGVTVMLVTHGPVRRCRHDLPYEFGEARRIWTTVPRRVVLLAGSTTRSSGTNTQKTPPGRAEFEWVVTHLEDPSADLVRKDSLFKKLGLDEADFQTPASSSASSRSTRC